MEELTSMGIISIIPALLAIALSFRTKNTIVALAVACIREAFCWASSSCSCILRA